MVADRIERETVIKAPVERVWELITEAEHLGRWFGDAGAEIDLRPGGAMVLRWSQHTARARVVAVEPRTRFSYRWAPFTSPGGEEPGQGNSTLVEFTLQPEGDNTTRLRVVESGFASLDTSDEQRGKNLSGNTEGWQRETDELREYAERVAA